MATCAVEFDAIVVAAGDGRRMGARLPGARRKAHMDLRSRPVLDHSIDALQRTPGWRRTIVVLHPEEFERGDEARRLEDAFGITAVACGGATRQQSVLAGLELTARGGQGAEVVLIHDAARPLVSPAVAAAVAEAAGRFGAAIAAVRAAHTVKQVGADGRILATPPRDALWFAHTPQGFRRELILRAHYAARADAFTGTDDAQLVERLGEPVYVVEDSPHNLKITTPEDMVVAEATLAWREGKEDKGEHAHEHE
jgi:2-C-methyl-D-erythritol 4-phosphate cytidylyltransferase